MINFDICIYEKILINKMVKVSILNWYQFNKYLSPYCTLDSHHFVTKALYYNKFFYRIQMPKRTRHVRWSLWASCRTAGSTNYNSSWNIQPWGNHRRSVSNMLLDNSGVWEGRDVSLHWAVGKYYRKTVIMWEIILKIFRFSINTGVVDYNGEIIIMYQFWQ